MTFFNIISSQPITLMPRVKNGHFVRSVAEESYASFKLVSRLKAICTKIAGYQEKIAYLPSEYSLKARVRKLEANAKVFHIYPIFSFTHARRLITEWEKQKSILEKEVASSIEMVSDLAGGALPKDLFANDDVARIKELQIAISSIKIILPYIQNPLLLSESTDIKITLQVVENLLNLYKSKIFLNLA